MTKQDILKYLNSMSQEELEEYNRLCRFVDDLENGMCGVPDDCINCPAHSVDFNRVVIDLCYLNTDVYSGDLWFAHHNKRPKWCPAVKYLKRGEENDAGL